MRKNDGFPAKIIKPSLFFCKFTTNSSFFAKLNINKADICLIPRFLLRQSSVLWI